MKRYSFRILLAFTMLLIIGSIPLYLLSLPTHADTLPPDPTPFKLYLPVISKPARIPSPSEVEQAMQQAIGFLNSQWNDEIGLLKESPLVGKHRYYLTNDNALAAYTLSTLGKEPDKVVTITAKLAYGYDHNGFIEAAWGVPIHWPPWHSQDVTVTVLGEDRIIQETHHAGLGFFYDWSGFSNLAFMGALNEHNLGYAQSARRLYEIEMSTWNGLGFQDMALWDDGLYETIGPAWALYVGFKIGAPMEQYGPVLVEALLQKQGPLGGGGFYTHYVTPTNFGGSDPNVETTCLVLLGLHAYSHYWQGQ